MNVPIIHAEINLTAIAHNIRILRKNVPTETRLMAVVKANGYGHGAVEVAKTAFENGAHSLGVARVQEGIELRHAGCGAPILIFGYTPPALANQLIEFDLTQTVYHPETARAYATVASDRGKLIKVHLKIDTGMGRLGLVADDGIPSVPEKGVYGNILTLTQEIMKLPSLEVEGIFTHFSTADSSDKSYTLEQLNKFFACLEMFRAAGFTFPILHAANSAALINLPEAHLDMVRPGIAVYGLYPSHFLAHGVDKTQVNLRPAMSLKSQIVHLKQVPPGFNISYGNTYKTKTAAIIATVPVGYADGFSRLLSSKGYMLIHGTRVPIVGRVCMDHTMVDVSHIHDVAVGDEVVIFGSQGDETFSADKIAGTLHTINYEIVSTIMPRVPRIYIH